MQILIKILVFSILFQQYDLTNKYIGLLKNYIYRNEILLETSIENLSKFLWLSWGFIVLIISSYIIYSVR